MLSIIREANARNFPQILVDLFASSRDTQLGREAGEFSEYRVLPGGGPKALRHRADLIDLLTEFKPDIVHSHLFHASALVATLHRHKFTTIITHHHGDQYLPPGHSVRRTIDRWSVRHHNVVVAASHFGMRVLVDEYGLPRTRVVVIPSGWDGQPITGGHREPDLVLCVANFRREKGHEVLLRALARVIVEFPSVRLRLVGDGPRASNLNKLAKNLGLTAHVEWAGAVENVWLHYAEASLFVMPSRTEQLGIAVLEAMAAGLPVIVSDVGGMRDLVNEKVGQTFTPGDDEELAAAMLLQLNNPELGLSQGAEGQIRASKLGMAHSVKRYFELYERHR